MSRNIDFFRDFRKEWNDYLTSSNTNNIYKKSKFCKDRKKGCRKQQIMIERSFYYAGEYIFCIQKYSYKYVSIYSAI